jgi:hypothetical protein
VRGFRKAAAGAALFGLLAACGSNGSGKESSPPVPGDRAPDTTTTTSTSVVAQPNCFLQGLSAGLPVATIEQRCALDNLINEIVASVRLRQGVANAFNAIRPGFGMTPKDVVDWETSACTNGPQVLNDLIGRVQPTPLQRLTLVSPLLDFASDAGTSCRPRPTLRDDLAAVAWRNAVSAEPSTATPAAAARDILAQQAAPPSVMADLLKSAHNACDVVGNGVVIGLKAWTGAQPPDWAQLALGTFASAICGKLLE